MQTLVFDLDGTLIDSAPDIHLAANDLMASIGQPAFGLSEIKSFIGNGVPVLVERVMAARALPSDQHAKLVARFMEFYSAEVVRLTRPYPHVKAALDDLLAQGCRLGICTNKPEEPTRRILTSLGLSRYFSAVVGGDSLPTRKPSPEPLLHTMTLLGAADCIYVGDSEIDAETAERAGVPFILFTEGYRKSDVQKINHRAAFDDFQALPGLI